MNVVDSKWTVKQRDYAHQFPTQSERLDFKWTLEQREFFTLDSTTNGTLWASKQRIFNIPIRQVL